MDAKTRLAQVVVADALLNKRTTGLIGANWSDARAGGRPAGRGRFGATFALPFATAQLEGGGGDN